MKQAIGAERGDKKAQEERGSSTELPDTNRLETFSDGVFAIVLTVLIIDVQPPVYESGKLMQALLEQWPEYAEFLTSFLFVALIWVNHHAAFRRIRHMNRSLNFINLALLAATASLPFPTAILAHAMWVNTRSDQRVAVLLYASVASLICASWFGLFHCLVRAPHLQEVSSEASYFARERMRATVGVAAYGFGAILCFLLTPQWSLVVFFAVPIAYGLTTEMSPRGANASGG